MKFIKGILIFFGILFLLQIILVITVYFWNPLGLWGENSLIDSSDRQTSTTYDHPLLNDAQQETLEKLGIDTSQIPSTITPEMEECFINELGQERADEIIAGDSPSAMDLMKTKDCLN